MNSQLVKTLAQIIKSLSQEERNLLEIELNCQNDWQTIKNRIINRNQHTGQQFKIENRELSIDNIFEEMREQRSEQLMQVCIPNIIKESKNDQ